MKVDDTVKRETLRVAKAVIVLSILMEFVFVLLKRWDYTVLLGNLVSGTVAIADFLLMGITIQKAVAKDEKDAQLTMKLSQMVRMLATLVIIAACVLLPYFNTWTSIIPLFFTRISMIGRGGDQK